MAGRDEVLLVGDGAWRYASYFAELSHVEVADQGLSYPSPASLVQLAHARALREEFVNPSEVQPLYLRPPDAAINWATRRGVSAAASVQGESDGDPPG
jgi:tRNA threonylcarbamoyladenosine biosynthesis protein TsaB